MPVRRWCKRLKVNISFTAIFIAAALLNAVTFAEEPSFQRHTNLYSLSSSQPLTSDITPGDSFYSQSNAYFDLTYGSGLQSDTLAQTAFNAAAAQWSSVLRDDVTVRLDLDYAPLETGVLGATSSTELVGSYQEVRGMVVNNAGETTNPRENLLLPNLPTKSQFSTFLPAGFDLDQEPDTGMQLSQANYHALGGTDSRFTASDGSITFSSNFSWDFDPSDGISDGKYDFVGVAVHEIGHALGFISDVDFVDQVLENGLTSTQVRPKPMDLFRFDTADLDDENFDFTTSTREMIPGGSDSFYYGDGSALLSTGAYAGDGKQSSHWKDDLSIGIMDPTVAAGELLAISENDLILMDLIGWDVDWQLIKQNFDQVPEPATAVIFALGAAVALRKRRSA